MRVDEADSLRDAEHIAAFILHAAEGATPHAFRQGPRSTPLQLAGGPALDLLATMRIRNVSELAIRGLTDVARGFPTAVLRNIPPARDVLLLQARGRRCVTLLPEHIPAPEPHTDALDFALHDLCHLAKFADPAHYQEQVGFFNALSQAFDDPHWRNIEAHLDPQWLRDRDSISADMNGSTVFLFAMLQMKLKMAARRSLGTAAQRGSLQPAELAAYQELLDPLLEAMRLPSPVQKAAATISARRDAPEPAMTIVEYFRARGARSLRSA